MTHCRLTVDMTHSHLRYHAHMQHLPPTFIRQRVNEALTHMCDVTLTSAIADASLRYHPLYTWLTHCIHDALTLNERYHPLYTWLTHITLTCLTRISQWVISSAIAKISPTVRYHPLYTWLTHIALACLTHISLTWLTHICDTHHICDFTHPYSCRTEWTRRSLMYKYMSHSPIYKCMRHSPIYIWMRHSLTCAIPLKSAIADASLKSNDTLTSTIWWFIFHHACGWATHSLSAVWKWMSEWLYLIYAIWMWVSEGLWNKLTHSHVRYDLLRPLM